MQESWWKVGGGVEPAAHTGFCPLRVPSPFTAWLVTKPGARLAVGLGPGCNPHLKWGGGGQVRRPRGAQLPDGLQLLREPTPVQRECAHGDALLSVTSTSQISELLVCRGLMVVPPPPWGLVALWVG